MVFQVRRIRNYFDISIFSSLPQTKNGCVLAILVITSFQNQIPKISQQYIIEKTTTTTTRKM